MDIWQETECPLTPPQLDQLVMAVEKGLQALLIEVRQELEQVGEQHRIDLLNNEPCDSGDESMANSGCTRRLTTRACNPAQLASE